MCKLNNIKDKQFIVYRIISENYVGVTTNLHKRLLKHRSRSSFNIDKVEILETHTELRTALNAELTYQEIFKCKLGVRNQEGNRNPFAKQVLHLETGIFYDTIKDACYALDYNYSDVRHKIKDNNNKYKLVKIK